MSRISIQLSRFVSISHNVIYQETLDSAGYVEEQSSLFSRYYEPETISLCHICNKKLLSTQSMDQLFSPGHRLTPTIQELCSSAARGCAMCRLVYYILLYAKGGHYRCLIDKALNSSLSLELNFLGYSSTSNGLSFKLEMYEGQSEILVAQAEENDSAAEFTTKRPSGFIDDAKAWFSECTEKHESCPAYDEAALPTRVLDTMTDAGTPGLRLYETHGMKGYYATLSYCWGADQPLKLTSARLADYNKNIMEETLPQSIRDAVYITRCLRLRYLWIDAYCIIQDSEEDKELEIGQMGSIYKNSHLTIEGSGSPSSETGFLDLREKSRVWPLPLRLPSGVRGTLFLKHWPYDTTTTGVEPIATRAWTMQENMLSPRIISFPSTGAKIEWHCKAISQSDCGIITTRPMNPLYRIMGWDSPHVPIHRFLRKWADVVHTFSERKLSVASDKLPALGAVAAEFQKVWGGEYYCGLWGRFFTIQLLWFVNCSYGDPETWGRRPSTYRAPSWSWASLDGTVVLNDAPNSTSNILEILEVAVELGIKANPFGTVRHAKLRVKGLLKMAIVCSDDLRDRCNDTRLGFAYIDEVAYTERDGCIMWTGKPKRMEVWCLAVTVNEGDSRGYETENSETSIDYPSESSGLLLVKTEGISHLGSVQSQPTYRRIGGLSSDTFCRVHSIG
ncbi:uncharacterized protein PAC_12527 [Phialocephala subalpina]|uniref:Heterokaryon incompatibility domain-containing protein n=1 Tax=Phialocephala subalpina TaxID=576137 RepID=A0A1L7XC60_9HELO|nr:uncharacterized protein PAC_12527 [Phialocephala subalpina]